MVNTDYVSDILAPDLIIVNGKVITVDKDFSIAEAVSVKDGRILAAGKRDDMEALRGAKTKTLDLQGKVLMPGINDSHLHLTWTLLSLPPYQLDLTYPKVKSIKDIRMQVKQAAANAEPG